MEQSQEQEIISLPRSGDKAPAFKAVTTQGEINFLADYKGKWTILFSHPADFTPVCTSAFMTFAHREPEFWLSTVNCLAFPSMVCTATLSGSEPSRPRLNLRA